jgi:glutathione S-transferase
MGTVPILDVGCACIPQSKAIERFVARRLGLLGIDLFEEALVDSVCELVRDVEHALNADESRFVIVNLTSHCVSRRSLLHHRFLSVDLPDALLVIDQFISRACGGFCVGCSLSLADIKVFQFLNPAIFRRQHDAWHTQLPPVLARFPRVAGLVSKVGAVAGIQAWVQKLH